MDATGTREAREHSLGELVQQLSHQAATLVRQEMRLAQVELQQKGKRAGLGAGMLGGAGATALFGAGALVAAAILALATAVEPWLAAVIVGAVLLAIAAVLALSGRRQVEKATPPVPERALASVQRDVDEVKERARR